MGSLSLATENPKSHVSKWHKTREAEAQRPKRRFFVNGKGNQIFDRHEDNITVLWSINNFNTIHLLDTFTEANCVVSDFLPKYRFDLTSTHVACFMIYYGIPESQLFTF